MGHCGYTNQTILANRPDRVLHDKKEKTCQPTDIAIPDDSNLNTKGSGKLSKYLEIEVSRMWKVRTKTVRVIIEALGTIKKGLDQKLLPGHSSAKEIQKITLMTTANIIYKVLESITLISC